MGSKRQRKEPRRGRKRGGHNKGFWHWKGRGWFASDYTCKTPRVPLLGENGEHLIDPAAAEAAKKAYARYLLGQQEQARRLAVGDTTPMFPAIL